MRVFALILNPVMFGDERFAPFGMIPLDFWTRQVLLWLSTFLFFSLFFFGKKIVATILSALVFASIILISTWVSATRFSKNEKN